MSRRSSRVASTPRSSGRRRRDDDERDDSEDDEQDQSGDEDIDEENGYNKQYDDRDEDEESDNNIHENRQNDSMDIVNEDDEKGTKDDANISKEELFARAVRDTTFFNARLQADKYSKTPFYFDPHTRSFQSIYSYRIRGPYDPENQKPVPNGYRPLEASRSQKPTLETYLSQLRQEKNKSGKYFTQLRQLLEQHEDFQLQAYQCYLDYQQAQHTHQKAVMHLNESLSHTRDYEDAPEQIPLWIQSRTEEKNMKLAKQKLIQYQLMIQQLQPKINQVYGILFPGVNPSVNSNHLTAPNVLPLSAQAAAAGITPAHLMSSNLRNQLAKMKNMPISRRKGERESSRLGKRGLESDEASGEESSQQPAKRRKLEVPTCADCDKQKNEEMLECSECGSFHHPSCLGLSKSTLRKVHTYKWKCSNCKVCEKCTSSGIEDKLLFCDYCDKAYHTYCLDPPLDKLPDGEWICSECMGEYMKNKEKLRILREKTAARRAAAKAKKMAKKKGGASRPRRKTKKETSEKESDEEEEDLEKSEGDQEEDDDEEDEEEISTKAKPNKRDDEKSLTGTEESEDGFEDPETAAKIALNLLSGLAVRAVSPTKDRRSKDVSDNEGVVAIKSDTEKVGEKKSLKVVVRRLPVKK
eukprot:TRINITY_DN2391_c0_g1_i1.p1 TRINITY_DN2391_c0_g1~~TRINITY_DN2391_c0_g1_i1.p1  ORF type:complete len:638 (+),score=120.75 TRINITY_DN2391_c0_g1_i1:22-1935(+)